MKKKKNKKKGISRGKSLKAEPQKGQFMRKCSRAALIAASYQIFSLCMDPAGKPDWPDAHDKTKTWLGKASSQISSALIGPANLWGAGVPPVNECRCVGGHGGGRGCGCTGCMGCQGGCQSCQGCMGRTAADESRETNDTGITYYRNGDFETAAQYFRKALGLSPNDEIIKGNLRNAEAGLHNKAGIKYYDDGDYEKAAEYFRKALELNPNNEIMKENLRNAEARLREKRERDRTVSEDIAKVKNIIEKIAVDFDTAPQGGSPAFDTVSPRAGGDTIVVDLSFMDPNKPMIVEPRKVKGQTPSAGDLGFMDPNKPAPTDILKNAPASKPSQKSEKELKAEAAFALATLSVKNANYDQALRYLQDARAAKPNDKKFQEAYNYVLSLKNSQMQIKQSAKANYLLDALDYGKGNWEKSIDYLNTLEFDRAGNVNSQAAEEARRNLKEAYAEFLARQAVDRIHRKDFEGAIASLERANELDPDNNGRRHFLSAIQESFEDIDRRRKTKGR